MVSTLIIEPENGLTADPSQDLVVVIDIKTMDLGFFSDSGIQNYTSGQKLTARKRPSPYYYSNSLQRN